MKYLVIVILFVALTSCDTRGAQESERMVKDSHTVCNELQTTIYLQPLGNYSQEEADKLKAEIESHKEEFGSVCIKEIKVLPRKPLTDNLKNEAKTRYRANKIIPELKKQLQGKSTIIGLTHKDISVYHNGRKDWGVIGLAFSATHACVISTFRMKKRSDFWKAAAHEFCHAFYGAPHCPKANPHCIMQDAKGKYTFGRSTGLCAYCKSRL